VGLAALSEWFTAAWNHRPRSAAILAWSGAAVLMLWNLGLMLQWGTHLIPERGPISWRAAAYNQLAVVPAEAMHALRSYLMGRSQLMDRIEREDVRQLTSPPSEGAK